GQPPPTFALTLRDLQLPGAAAPTTLTVDAAGAAGIEDALLHLVLGLVQAQASALAAAAPALGALAGLLGLRSGTAAPPLPIDDVVQHGVGALTTWLQSVVTNTAARAAWLA